MQKATSDAKVSDEKSESMNMLFGNEWSVDRNNLPSDIHYNFSIMNNFPFDEFNSWIKNDKDYNKGGIGRGQPKPRYLLQKINIFNTKYMTATLYNNGSFNHKSFLITREPNVLIDNTIRLQLCSLINKISLRKEAMDYRYRRKTLLQKVVNEYNKEKEDWRTNTLICCKCFRDYSEESWSNALQKNIPVDECPHCGQQRISMNTVLNKYLLENNDNKMDEIEFDLFKQRINDIIDPLLDSDKYWRPSVFIYNKQNNKYEIKTEKLNENLFYIDKCKKNLYETLGNIFTRIIPMFEWVLNKKINRIYNKLNVVISIQDYQLKPGEIYRGRTHREGYKEENIVGAGVYYFDLTDDIIGNDIFEISAAFTGVWRHNKKPASVYYSSHQIRGEVHQVHIKEGNILVFNNNNINHSLKELQNISETEVSHRKIVVFMLVNPDLEPQKVSIPQVSLNQSNYNVDHIDHCKKLIDSILFDIGLNNCKEMKFPDDIKDMIVRYVIDKLVERRENRNDVRYKRFVGPEREETPNLNSYKTDWIGIA
eukprot:321409_1